MVDKQLEVAPQRVVSHLVAAYSLVDLGRIEEALRRLQLEPAEWARLTGLAVVHHVAGRACESDQALRELIERSASAAYQIAVVHAVRHDRNAMFEWLDRALEGHDAGLVSAPTEPWFRPHHDDPRWAEFLRKMGV